MQKTGRRTSEAFMNQLRKRSFSKNLWRRNRAKPGDENMRENMRRCI